MDVEDMQELFSSASASLATLFQKIPGSAVIIRYVESSYQNDPVRSALELVLVLFVIRYMLAQSYSTQRKNFVELTAAEIDEMVQEWTPEPLVAERTPLEKAEAAKLPVIAGATGPRCKLVNGKSVYNMASYNFYNFNANEQIKTRAIEVLREYGVGPCGPPQFYGTQDVHIKAQKDIASFLGTESSIIYSQAFSTVTSVIPSFCKRGDIIIADSGSNYAIRRGLEISRSIVKWYRHNDMADLERVIQSVVRDQAGRKLTRRFIVTEGLFETLGDRPDLPAILALKDKYKFRIILDETWSFGVLGRNGRGLTEAQNVDPSDVDMIIGSLAGPLCAGGGFCAGTDLVTSHQRITALSYTFSAALPAISAVTASEAVSLLASNPDIIGQCRDNISAMRAQLDPRSDWVSCLSDPENPVMLLVLKPEVVAARGLSREAEESLLQDIVDEALVNGVLITRLKRIPVEMSIAPKDEFADPRPALKVCVTSGLAKKDMEKVGTTIRHAITKVMKQTVKA